MVRDASGAGGRPRMSLWQPGYNHSHAAVVARSRTGLQGRSCMPVTTATRAVCRSLRPCRRHRKHWLRDRPDLGTNGAAPVWLAYRTVPNIVRHATGGHPGAVDRHRGPAPPPRLVDQVGALMARSVPDLTAYGLPRDSRAVLARARRRDPRAGRRDHRCDPRSARAARADARALRRCGRGPWSTAAD